MGHRSQCSQTRQTSTELLGKLAYRLAGAHGKTQWQASQWYRSNRLDRDAARHGALPCQPAV